MTIGELKEAIKNLPDGMEVWGDVVKAGKIHPYLTSSIVSCAVEQDVLYVKLIYIDI